MNRQEKRGRGGQENASPLPGRRASLPIRVAGPSCWSAAGWITGLWMSHVCIMPPETVPCARPFVWPTSEQCLERSARSQAASSASSSCFSTQLLRMSSATPICLRRAFLSRARCARSRERARLGRHTRKIPLRKCVQLINQGDEPSTLGRVAHSIARGTFRRAGRQSAR
jgi:hypothetical protein